MKQETKPSLEFAIGEVDPIKKGTEQKFIVSFNRAQPTKLIYYAKNLSDTISRHEQIAHRIDRTGEILVTIGGGLCAIEGRAIELSYESADYGAVPKEVLEEFKPQLIKVYGKMPVDIKTRPLQTFSDEQRLERMVRRLQQYQKLPGFSTPTWSKLLKQYGGKK